MGSPLVAANFFPVGCRKPKKVGKHCATACNHFHTACISAQSFSSVSILSHSTFLLDVQSSTDKKLATTARHCRAPIKSSIVILRSKQYYHIVTVLV